MFVPQFIGKGKSMLKKLDHDLGLTHLDISVGGTVTGHEELYG